MTWSKKYEKCLICGTIDRKHIGIGLCSLCYKRKKTNYKGRNKRTLCWSRKYDFCQKCGTKERYHEAFGLCWLCYNHKKHPLTGGRKITSTIIECSNCGKEFLEYQWYIKRSKHLFCSKECFRKWNRGKNHFWYRGGSGWSKYPKEFFALREQIRARDNYKCRLCGIPQIECFDKLSVHHINYDKYDLRSNNLISLCRKCHRKTNYKREEWIKKLDLILYNNF